MNLLQLLLCSTSVSLSTKTSLPLASISVLISRPSNLMVFCFIALFLSFLLVVSMPLVKDSTRTLSWLLKNPFGDPWMPNNTKKWVLSRHSSISACNSFFRPHSVAGFLKVNITPPSD